MTYQEMCEKVAKEILNRHLQYETDNHGQLIFYTGIYEHTDGSLQNNCMAL